MDGPDVSSANNAYGGNSSAMRFPAIPLSPGRLGRSRSTDSNSQRAASLEAKSALDSAENQSRAAKEEADRARDALDTARKEWASATDAEDSEEKRDKVANALRNLDVHQRLAEMALKMYELEDKVRQEKLARFLEIERRTTSNNANTDYIAQAEEHISSSAVNIPQQDSISNPALESSTTTQVVAEAEAAADFHQAANEFHQRVAEIQGRGYRLRGSRPQVTRMQQRFQPVIQRRVACYVPCHGFDMDILSNCHVPYRGFDLDKLPKRKRRIATAHLSRPLGRTNDYQPGYGSIGIEPFGPASWTRPHTIHDPNWSWDFEIKDIAIARRSIPTVLSSTPLQESSGSVPNIETSQYIIVFDFGAVVMWNMSEPHEHSILQSLEPFGEEPTEPEGEEYARDTLDFEKKVLVQEPQTQRGQVHQIQPLKPLEQFQETNASFISNLIDKDVVFIQTGCVDELLAYSFALAQSCLMRVFEWRSQRVIHRNAHIPMGLIKNGFDSLSQREISREIGWIFYERSKVLLSEAIDPAQYFWVNNDYEEHYLKARRYFEIKERKDRLDIKLSQLKDLFEMLATQAHNIHGVHLEWIVIILIAIELFCSLVYKIILQDFFGFRFANALPSS